MGQRKILFRGKRVDNGEWVYGDLINNEGSVFIFISYGVKPNGFEYVKIGGATVGYIVEVIPETVGQFTGIADKNGIKIFERDLLKGGIFLEYEVKWDSEQGGWNITESALNFYVIGNIHENPELLHP